MTNQSQGIKDALADAQMLRAFDPDASRCAITERLWPFWGDEDKAWDAVFAAHEAFTLVPGLRGEQ